MKETINDDFMDIGRIYEALHFNIPVEVFHKWYAYQLDWHTEEKEWNPINLINYYRSYDKKTINKRF